MPVDERRQPSRLAFLFLAAGSTPHFDYVRNRTDGGPAEAYNNLGQRQELARYAIQPTRKKRK